MASADSTNLAALIGQVETVVSAGGTTTTEYERVLTRWRDFANRDRTALDRLSDALTGDAHPDDLATLNALALAEQASTPDRAYVSNHAAGAVFTALRGEVKKVSEANYNTIREAFNVAAESFTKLCRTVDPDADPATLMTGTDAQRKAWATAAIQAPQLDQMIPALESAARLAGITIPGNEGLLALTVNPGKNHRRRIWEAWDNTEDSRAGRWGALIKAGAAIEAPKLDDYKPYKRPADPEWKYVRGAIGTKQYLEDPADAEHAAHQKQAAQAA